MTDAGVFNPAARAAILEAGNGRCVACGRPDVTTQHRRARGMGGTSEVSIGHPANGVPLCGDGVRGCHGWAEHHPHDAELLGYRLAPGARALEAPFWTRYGWRRWHVGPDGFPSIVYVDELEDLDRVEERRAAIVRYRLAGPVPRELPKPTR